MPICYDSYKTCKKRRLAMDANSIISAFIASSNQYVVNASDDNLMQLQRHLELLVCLTTTSSDLGFFQSGNPLASQCITHIVNLLLDNNTKCTVIPRVISVLQNLCKSSELNKTLQTVFHVHSAISVFLQHYGIDVKDPLVLQCLHLLERVTYDITIEYIESHLENLIIALLKLIETESSQLLKTSLQILANLIRHNVNVQKYICILPNFKQTVKRIVSMLNSEQPQVLVYALSILASVTPNHSIGTKFWTDEHLMGTFKIIIKLLFGTDGSCAIAALDLFLDLIKVPKYQSCFVKSPYLSTFLKKIPKILNDKIIDQSVLYLQILHALISIPDCSVKICSALCVSDEKVDDSTDIKIHPKIIHWCTSDEPTEKACNLSLKLLKSFLIINIESNNYDKIENSTKEILKAILTEMKVPCITELIVLERQLETCMSVFEIITFLCLKTNLKNFILEHVNLNVCEEFAKMLLDKCKIVEGENSGECIDLFLMVLEVISLVDNNTSQPQKVSCKILKDLRSMQFLAYALTSNNNDRVKRGLLLISLIKDADCLDMLSKNLLVCNSNIHKRLAHSPASDATDCSFSSEGGQFLKKSNGHLNDSFEKNIDSLLTRIEQGLNIKELKRSEIMDLYENKIAILTRKEQELQSYVEAKTAALQKADQIMTQYKCRQADSDAEALRLRTMLKDFESRCEKASMQFERAQRECKKQKEELDTALYKIKELQQNQKEQQELMKTQMSRQYEQKKSFEEEKVRLSEIISVKDNEKKSLLNQIQQMEEDMKLKCKEYEVLEESRNDLLKRIEELKKASEKLKENLEEKEKAVESAQQIIEDLENKNENLNNEMHKKVEEYNEQISELKEQLKLKDSKIADLNESVQQLSTYLNERSDELQKAELSIDKLKTALEKTENQNSELEKDIKMLKLLCKRYEASLEKKDNELKVLSDELEDIRKQCEEEIQQKEDQIKDLEAELEKHEYITGMINQMTSKIAQKKSSSNPEA